MRLIIALLHTLTLRKIGVFIQAQFAFMIARLFGLDLKPAVPTFVTLEPTNRCNLSCPECITGAGQMKRSVGDLSLADFSAIVDQIYRHTLVLNLYMQGEPYLNAELPQMIAYAKARSLFVSLSTNAQRLPELSKESLPHHLIISVDGATQESYEAYRVGGKLEKVQDFVQAVSDWKTKRDEGLPFVELQFLVHRKNEGEVAATKALFKGQYDRFVCKSMQIINEENKSDFLSQTTINKRYVKHETLRRACYKMLSTSVITQDGQLVLCCMDKNAEWVRGNVLQQDYVKLLQNDKARSYRKMLINDKRKMSICNNCPFA